MAIGYHEHMRNLEVGDDLVLRMERLSEAWEIDQTEKNLLRLKQAIQELNDHTDRMNVLYGMNDADKKAAA